MIRLGGKVIVAFLVLVAGVCLVIPRGDAPVEAMAGNAETALPVFSLEAKGRISSETKIPFKLRVEGEHALADKELAGLVRIHGASSTMYPKKSFAITLEKPQRWFGMRETAHWVLNAAFVDRSLMRHKLSYDLFRSLSRTNAPRYASESRFVEVNLNGRYCGVYLLMQRIDRAMLDLQRYDSNAVEHACIYKAIDHSATFDRLGHNGYEQREPDPLLQSYWRPLDLFNRFTSQTRDDRFFDEKSGIATQLDLENTIDFHLLVLLTGNMDGFDKNLLIARDAPRLNAPAPRFFFVPWDYDATFGQTWSGDSFTPAAWLSNPLFERLLENPDYRQRFGARWKQLRQREFSLATIKGMIDENVRVLGSAAARNAERWGGESVQDETARMRRWLEQRLKWLDREIARRAS